MVGVNGRIHLFSRPYVKNSTPTYKRILTSFYDPDNLSSINSLPSKFKNPHLYPTSVDHLFLLLQNEFLRCGELEDLTYQVLPGLTVNQTNARHLANYTKLLKQLCTNHITIYFNTFLQHGRHSNDTSVRYTRRTFLCLRLLWSFRHCSSIVNLGPRFPVHHRNNASIQSSRSTAQAIGAQMQPRKSSKHLPSARPSHRWKDFL